MGGITINTHGLASWGKCIPFQFLEKMGIYQHACIMFYPLCIPKRILKLEIKETLCGSLYSWHPREHNLPTGPYIFPMSPFGRATDWNLRECTRLWPLYTTLWCWPGREIGLTLPSINPKQFLRGAPFAWITSAYSCSIGGLNISKFHCEIRWPWLKKNMIHYCIGNHTYFRNWSCETMNHVWIATWIREALQKHKKPFSSVTRCSLWTADSV